MILHISSAPVETLFTSHKISKRRAPFNVNCWQNFGKKQTKSKLLGKKYFEALYMHDMKCIRCNSTKFLID